jgi:hypothetical protein
MLLPSAPVVFDTPEHLSSKHATATEAHCLLLLHAAPSASAASPSSPAT